MDSAQRLPAGAEIVVEDRIRSTGEHIVRKYLKGKLLGKGGFAKCYELTDLSTNVLYAGKVVEKASLKKPRAKQKLLAEIKIHRSLNHKHVVKFEHFFEDKDNVYILLELCPNKSMMDLVKRRKRLTEPEAAFYMLQLIDAMKYMHGLRVIHRDLKLGNLFLNADMDVKIGDFGLATTLSCDGERKRTMCGTPNYIAPEILDGKSGHSYEADIWSLGVILYTFLFGRPPFETSDVKTTYKRIQANMYSFPDHVPASPHVKNLIKSILMTQPELRPSLDKIRAHPWFTSLTIPSCIPLSALAAPTRTAGTAAAAAASSAAGASAAQPSSSVVSLPAAATAAASVSTAVSASLVPVSAAAAREPLSAAPRVPILPLATVSKAYAASVGVAPPLTAPAHAVQPFAPAPQPSAAPHAGTASARPAPLTAHSAAMALSTLSLGAPATAAAVSARPATAHHAAPTPVPHTASAFALSAVGSTAPVAQPVPTPAPAPTPTLALAASSVVSAAAAAAAALTAAPAAPVAPSAAPAGLAAPALASVSVPAAVAAAPVAVPAPSIATAVSVTALAAAAAAVDDEDRRSLDGMRQQLELSTAEGLVGPARMVLVDAKAEAPPQWITKWVDYSNKYGLGYQLCNNTVGVYFNDATKIVLAPDEMTVVYVESRRSAAGTAAEERRVFRLTEYPAELHKKVTLLKHFRSYLLESGNENAKPDAPAKEFGVGSTAPLAATGAGGSGAKLFPDAAQLPFVKKWLRTRHAIIFRLSNQIIQINFFDHTKLVLSPEAQLVTYINKQREKSVHPLATVAQEHCGELVHRLKYTKDILHQLASERAGH